MSGFFAPKLSGGLKRIEIDWFPGIEINPLGTVETYVADGFGVGFRVSIPKTKMSLKVLSLLLHGRAPVAFGALSREKDIVSIADVAGRINGNRGSFTS
ncbi:MAG TPA: hypothetical protein VN048_07910 [Verrucomicrobiae bacterium]|jgi:hypothetical protein|nr:hypothetical protein [Verrucomicrobiae bacterium]